MSDGVHATRARFHRAAHRFVRSAALVASFIVACSASPSRPTSAPSGVGVGPTAEKKADLKTALAALDDSVSPLDLRGSPADAEEQAQRVEAAAKAVGDAALVFQARRVQAYAAGAGGNYAKAVDLGRTMMKDATPGDFTALAAAVWSWERLRLSAGQLSFYVGSDLTVRFPEQFGRSPIRPDASDPDFTAQSALLYALANQATNEGTLSSGALDQPKLSSIADTLVDGTRDEACRSAGCPWGSVLAARLYEAARDLGRARAELAKAGELARADRKLAGVIALMSGDLIAAPNSDVFDLNLASQRLSRTILETNSGVPPQAFSPVSADALKQARGFYATAAAAFHDAQQPRGLAQVDARAAYAHFVVGEYGAAASGFAAVAQTLRAIGDRHEALRAAQAGIASLLAQGDYGAAAKALDALTAELAEQRALGVVIAGVQLFRTLARWGDTVKHDTRMSLEALTIARRFSEDGQLPYANNEVQAELANVYTFLGRRSDALNSWDNAGAALDRFAARLNETPENGAFKRSQQLANIEAQRGYLEQATISDLLALRDFEHARLHNERLKRLIPQIPFAPVQAELRSVVAEDDAALMLNGVIPPSGLDPVGKTLLLIRDGKLREARAPLVDVRKRAMAGLKGLTASDNMLIVQSAKQELELAVSLHELGGQIEVAEQVFDAGEKYKSGWLFSNPVQPWERMRYLAVFSANRHKNADAERMFRDAVESVEQQALVAGGPQERASFFEETRAPFTSYMRFLLDEKRSGDALAILERSRARIFQTQLELASAFQSDSPKGRLVAAWRSGHAELAGLNRGIAEAIAVGDQAKRESARGEADRVRTKLAQLDAEMSASAISLPVHAAETDGVALARSIAESMAQDVPTTILVYADVGEDVWAWVLNKQGIVVALRLPTSAHEIRRRSAALINQITSTADALAEARDLYDALLAPLAKLLPKHDERSMVFPRIGILPPARLQQVPFQALRSSNSALVESNDIFYLPSLESYVDAVANSRKRQHSPVVRAFGPEQPSQAAAEARAVADPGDAFVDAAATKAALLSASGAAGILHLATHGDVNRLSPFLSSLQFRPGEELYGYEILGLDVKSWLVTLSACNSGISAASTNGEITSIGGAFLSAGVPSVVGAAWVVSDPVAVETIKAFYKRLGQHADPATALGDAQRAALGTGLYPLYWSPLFLMGSDQ